MINKKEYGIVFQIGNNCGKANITVFNLTRNRFIDTKGNETINPVYRTVDLFFSAAPNSPSSPDNFFVYWITLNDGESYSITVVNAGIHNSLAISPYNVNIESFLETETMIGGNINTQLMMWHADFPSTVYIFNIVNEDAKETAQITYYDGNGITSDFEITKSGHIDKFLMCSEDGGKTWIYPNDPDITWGSNEPYYDDEIFDTNKQAFIKFVESPLSGSSNIMIKWRPYVNKYKVVYTTRQPKTINGDYVDSRITIRLLENSIEFIK